MGNLKDMPLPGLIVIVVIVTLSTGFFVVDQTERCFNAAEEILFDLTFYVAGLHHVLDDTILARAIGAN